MHNFYARFLLEIDNKLQLITRPTKGGRRRGMVSHSYSTTLAYLQVRTVTESSTDPPAVPLAVPSTHYPPTDC